jgi:hypothetical protein
VGSRTIGEIMEMNSRGFSFASGFGHQQCFAKSNHSKESRAPLSKQRKVIDKPTQRLVNLREYANHDHQSAERTSAAEICGRRDDDRSDNRNPSVSGSHPGECCGSVNNPTRYSPDLTESGTEPSLLPLLVTKPGGALQPLICSNKCEVQFGFAL